MTKSVFHFHSQNFNIKLLKYFEKTNIIKVILHLPDISVYYILEKDERITR